MTQKMMFNTTLTLFALLCLSGCFKKDNATVDMKNQSAVSTLEKSSSELFKNEEVKKKNIELKEMREVLHFAASIERESLRLITKITGFDSSTLFSILTYVYEIESGVKKASPTGLDCNRFNFIDNPIETQIYKTCFKPSILIATIKKSKSLNEFEVLFKVKEWASIIGMSVSLTNSDIECHLKTKEKKLEFMTCHNWAYRLIESATSSTEIRLSTFQFQRNEKAQLVLKGGFFKDLVENKKIEISVPLEGKIKLIEKELEVRDDFAAQIKEPAVQIKESAEQNTEVKNEKKEAEQKNEDYQKWIKEGSSQTPEAHQQQNQNAKQEDKQESSQGGSQEGGQQEVKPESQSEGQVQSESEVESDQNNGGVPKPATGRSHRSR